MANVAKRMASSGPVRIYRRSPPAIPIEAVAGPATMVQAHKVSSGSGSPKPTSLARPLSELEGRCLERRPSAFSPSEPGASGNRFADTVPKRTPRPKLRNAVLFDFIGERGGTRPSTPRLKSEDHWFA